MSFKGPLPDPATTLEITPERVSVWSEQPREKRPRLIDCREADEVAICRLVGSDWIPLGSFPEAGAKLTANSERGIVVYCHHGMRSMRAAAFLRAQGVKNAFSMSGGIDLWSQIINPHVPRY